MVATVKFVIIMNETKICTSCDINNIITLDFYKLIVLPKEAFCEALGKKAQLE